MHYAMHLLAFHAHTQTYTHTLHAKHTHTQLNFQASFHTTRVIIIEEHNINVPLWTYSYDTNEIFPEGW